MERMDNVEAARNVKMRKWVIITVTKCYRLVCNHPFLVVTLYLLFLVYRSFPFLFSTLVSISPVLVCTGVLLGTLLNFGQPDKPGVKDGYSFSHDTSFKGSSNLEPAIVDHDSGENHVAKRFISEKQDVVEKFIEEATITFVSEKDDDVYNNTNMTLSSTSCCKVSSKKEDDEYMKKGSPDMEVEMKREVCKRRFNINYEGVVESSEGDLEIHRESGGPINSDDVMKCPSPFEWKEDDDYAASREEDDDEDCQSLNTDPGKVECSPRNPLKDHVFHMLDGSHPFLEKEASLLAQLSCDDFEASAKHTHKSQNGIKDSNEDCSIMREKDDGTDKGAGRKMEEESKEAKNNDEEKKSAISWTGDDQNNLMVLGTSETERNRRLDSLIARRRARKSLGLMFESNLIDLDGPDLPFDIPAVATTRRNPFDGPDNYYASMGLPPIPGSAPSVMVPRQNPFDLPYEPNEEKPNLKGDSFQQEFSFDQNKDVLFSRHASFNVRQTSYKQEKQDFKRRPYFVSEAEQLGLEESSNSLFQRQMSDASDSNSKLSSIPDTESEISNADNNDRSFGIQECYEDPEVTSNDQPMLLLEQENESCEGIVYDDTEEEDEGAIPHDGSVITLGKMETENLMESTFTKSKAAVFPLDLIMDSSPLRTASSIEEECNSMSRSSSFSEVNGVVLNVKNDTMRNSNTRIDMTMEKSLETENPSEVCDFSFPDLTTDENLQKEAIYDSSPQTVDKLLSLCSISSDNFEETFAVLLSPESINATHNIEDEPNYEEMFAAFSKMEDESGSRSKEVREIKESTSYDIISSEVKETSDSDHDFLVPESVVKHEPTGLSSPSSVTESVKGHAISEGHFKNNFFKTHKF